MPDSENLSMSTVTQVSSTRFVEMFREKCHCLRLQLHIGGFTNTSERFLPLEAAAVQELTNTLSRVACFSATEIQQLHAELITSPFGSQAKSKLFKACNDKVSLVRINCRSEAKCSRARVMLGLQYLTR